MIELPLDDSRNEQLFFLLGSILKERATVLNYLIDIHVDANLRLTVATFYEERVLSICQQILSANGFAFVENK